MSKETYKLKSNGQQVYPMPWKATCPRPWPETHMRVVIPFNEIELRDSRKEQKSHICIVRKDNLRVA